jgi:hypothetical protein
MADKVLEMIGEDSRLKDAMDWIINLRDLKLICHTVRLLLADAVWIGAMYSAHVPASDCFPIRIYLVAQSISPL